MPDAVKPRTPSLKVMVQLVRLANVMGLGAEWKRVCLLILEWHIVVRAIEMPSPKAKNRLNCFGRFVDVLCCCSCDLHAIPLGYREAHKISWGRPWPKPIRVVGPFVFYAFAPDERKNVHEYLIFDWPYIFQQ